MNEDELEADVNTADDEENPSSGVGMWIVLGGGLAAGIAGVYWLWRYFYWERVNNRVAEILSSQIESKDAWGQVGTMGDSFGALSALFTGVGVVVSAIAFLGFIYALKMQRDDLNLQRKEMKRTRKVISQQATTAKKQLDMATQGMLSTALPAHIQLMQVKSHVLKDNELNMELFDTRLEKFIIQLPCLIQYEDLGQMLQKRDITVLRDLCLLVKYLRQIEPWQNIIYIWEEKVDSLTLDKKDKSRYKKHFLQCCTTSETVLYILGKIRHGREIENREVFLEQLYNLLLIRDEPTDEFTVRSMLYVACDIIEQTDYEMIVDVYKVGISEQKRVAEEIQRIARASLKAYERYTHQTAELIR